ncbi:MAG: rod shape-determining protein [Acidaminococcus sp.]|jgi:rod shape-determining protein MreB|nr:rod shape-determining protein [Acidaminococcus sp.]MCI2100357.1 rod shape-determining protein [Acidaminococcus sp.]MCI2114678.1 rod shape-determining protein [Acidaminococcus sp.]MCI2116670.1 rod shape-determining protein [Acidaminococcus sp.]
MGIDLGTANTLICSKTAGIILREPSVVAVHKKTGKVIAVGSNAYRMIGRTPEYLTTVHPLKDGVIADFDMARIMLHAFLKKALRGRSFVHPRFVISIPCGVTAVERRAVIDTAIQAGGREAFLIEAPLAAAMGAGMFIREAAGNMVVDIGGGTTEAAVISLGSIVQSRTLRIGGNRLDEALVRYIKRKYNLLISLPMAEMMKVEIGTILETTRPASMEVSGRDLVSGLPKTLTINQNQVIPALADTVREIVDAVKTTIEQTPPELASDIMDRGIVLTGGTALLRNLDRVLSRETGMPVAVAEDALSCVALGTGKAAKNLNYVRRTAGVPAHKK